MTLVEVMVGVALMGMMLVSLYAGFAYGFAEIRLSRENVRATQILQERMEVLRVVNWDQVTAPNYIPSTFTAPYYSKYMTNEAAGDFTYTGKVTVAPAPLTESYAGDLRMITIELSWPSGTTTRKRKMITFVSQYGFQKYVY